MLNRHQFRAKWHDYNGGIYFVTICSHEKRHLFGGISNGVMHKSKTGQIADNCISQISTHHKFPVEILNYVIMPNHIHMIICIDPVPVRAQYIAPPSGCPPQSPSGCQPINPGAIKPPKHGDSCGDIHFNSKLAVVVRTFKAAVSRILSSQMRTSSMRAQCIAPLPIWQRNFHEHIIRNQRAFDNIMLYIDSNVECWNSDCFNY